jgi:hypothetical protein
MASTKTNEHISNDGQTNSVNAMSKGSKLNYERASRYSHSNVKTNVLNSDGDGSGLLMRRNRPHVLMNMKKKRKNMQTLMPSDGNHNPQVLIYLSTI